MTPDHALIPEPQFLHMSTRMMQRRAGSQACLTLSPKVPGHAHTCVRRQGLERAQVRPTDTQRRQGLIPQVQSLGAAPRTSTLPGGGGPFPAPPVCDGLTASVPDPVPRLSAGLLSRAATHPFIKPTSHTGVDAERGQCTSRPVREQPQRTGRRLSARHPL